MRRPVLALAILCLSFTAWSFNLDGNRWPEGETTFFVDIPGAAPSGVTWNEAFEDSMAQWTDQTDFNFLLNPSYVDPCSGFNANDSNEGFPDGGGDGLNGADFTDDVCGNAYGLRVLAITLSIALPGNLGFALVDQTDIVFNNSFDWDIYTGPRRSEVDFRRVALHELGHSVGLGHENSAPAMMASSIGDIDALQTDDITGANALYGGPGDCEISDLSINTVVDNALEEGDCAVLELYAGGQDTSFVDTYRLILEEETTLSIIMESAVLDSVLIVTDDKLNGVDFDDDSTGNCDALINSTFPAGEYLILANTYDTPFKCNGNTGGYKISISDNALPILTDARSASGQISKSIFHGGATSDGIAYKSSFLPSEAIDVTASIQPDLTHVGEGATFYVVALLDSGQILARNDSGKYTKISKLANIPAFSHTDNLQPEEPFTLISNLKGESFGVTNLAISFYVGYSLDSEPSDIYFNGTAISFSIE
ncbi:MAG: matrixin family metalloprotease [Gammaproteobacteria bacterium]|nr:matrixin family metalloprotease [Gammaproteobacteria bacterium]